MSQNVILKNYTRFGKYLRFENGAVTELAEYSGKYDGFYQHHAIGTIYFSLTSTPEPLLQIGRKKYDIHTLHEVAYIVQGNTRIVRFTGANNELMKEFTYDVFWVTDVDLLEIAFGLPEDIERDLLKHISVRLKAQAPGKKSSPNGKTINILHSPLQRRKKFDICDL